MLQNPDREDGVRVGGGGDVSTVRGPGHRLTLKCSKEPRYHVYRISGEKFRFRTIFRSNGVSF